MPRYKDISLTFRKHPVTGDVVKLFDEDAIKASVMNLVMTMNYEIPFHPEIGCDVYKSLFENISVMTAIRIRKSVMDVIQNFEPRVSLLDVNVNPNLDANAYNLTIIFRIINHPDPTELSILLNKY